MAIGSGLSPELDMTRIYRGEAPAVPISNIFDITTFELG
tara:strand:- start:635 stop:751 length:117 start_codon:yes stop_codon:yes gene_type:complete